VIRVFADVVRGKSDHIGSMLMRASENFRTGDALFAFDEKLRVLSWNKAAEVMTGVPAREAVGRFCWEVLGGLDGDGSLVCHAGCSNARLAREGWPLRSRDLRVRTPAGRRRVSLATIALHRGERPVFLHLMRDETPRTRRTTTDGVAALTPRQRQVLALLAEGVPAKVIAVRLGLAEPTVRNHIRAILHALGCHSQLEALARARRLELV
jgi:PAS domain S-box-containing protein